MTLTLCALLGFGIAAVCSIAGYAIGRAAQERKDEEIICSMFRELERLKAQSAYVLVTRGVGGRGGQRDLN
jgi:hypothetical protein